MIYVTTAITGTSDQFKGAGGHVICRRRCVDLDDRMKSHASLAHPLLRLPSGWASKVCEVFDARKCEQHLNVFQGSPLIDANAGLEFNKEPKLATGKVLSMLEVIQLQE